jgi:NAD(P)-dependent dehydrogenase (short-subunit alcohol dehydrogenase family)
MREVTEIVGREFGALDGLANNAGISLPVDGGWTADASWNSLRLRTRA